MPYASGADRVPTGVMVGGVPIGDAEYVRAVMDQQATEICELIENTATELQSTKTKSRDAARPFDPMPPRLRPPGTGTFRLWARPGSARASVSNSPQYVFVLAR